HRYLTFKSPVVSFGKPNAAHTAVADLRHQCISANHLTLQTRSSRQSQGMSFEETLLGHRVTLMEEYLQLVRELRTLSTHGGQPDRLFFVRHFKRFVQVRTQDLPLVGGQCGHRSSDWKSGAMVWWR